jgi:polysaccharide deacetylase family protein (PEP-CTERM system associated)
MIPCHLTFDVEDWFQVENLRPLFPPPSWEAIPRRVARSTGDILRLLEDRGIRSTFFVLGWVAEREPALVREIAAAGHEIACHGYGHVLPMQLGLREFEADVRRAREVLEDIGGQEVIGYRAPSFSIDAARLEVLSHCGFRYDSSHHPFGAHDRYGRLPELGRPVMPGVYRFDSRLVEFELPVERLGPLSLPVSGGGYLRLYPGLLFRRLARRAIARRGHYVCYLHSWEFDPSQPRVRRAGVIRTFRHYNNLSLTLERMKRLITMLERLGARFQTLREFLREIPAPMERAS